MKVPFPSNLTHPDVYDCSKGAYKTANIPSIHALDARNIMNNPCGLVINVSTILAGCIRKGFVVSLFTLKSMLGMASAVANQ